MEIDTNENNYDYDKLLKLFALTPNFDKYDLKKVKKKVLMLHPDKSKIPQKIFIFMLKMYYKLEQIYLYTNKDNTNLHNLSLNYEADKTFKSYLEQNNINPMTNYKKFSQEFNKMFESVYISDNSDGYSDWLKSDEDIYNKNDLEESRQSAIKKNGEIVKTEDLEEIGNNFRNFHTDIKESYSNPFLALDINKTYNEKKKFKNVEEYRRFLAKQDKNNEPLSKDASLKFIKNKEDLLSDQCKQIAFDNMMNEERTNKKYNKYISQHLKIEN
uniref:J domain-containing protein n=1 Tax=Florenciella sp. virus SA2 TaxID=3240092 RepID=A0AB39JF57_9VIRU